MAEFQWWLLIVGLVAGGGLVAIVSMDGRRREDDLADLERRAEAAWIAAQLSRGHGPDPAIVEAVLRIHREYLTLPPPDRIVVEGGARAPEHDAGLADRDADRDPDDVGDDRGQ